MIRSVSSYNEDFNYVLLSRKSLNRSGMRFLCRGVDKNGHVANFAETEQYVIQKKLSEDIVNFISYLQIRGSIPLFWTQLPDLKLNPKINFDNEHRDNYQYFEKHTNSITNDYGKIVYINLIDKKGDQNMIGDYLNTLHKDYKESRSHSSNYLQLIKICSEIF